MTTNTETPASIASEIYGTDAAAVLLNDGTPYRSFCNGYDVLEARGLISGDGEVTELGYEVRELLREYARIDRLTPWD